MTVEISSTIAKWLPHEPEALPVCQQIASHLPELVNQQWEGNETGGGDGQQTGVWEDMEGVNPTVMAHTGSYPPFLKLPTPFLSLDLRQKFPFHRSEETIAEQKAYRDVRAF